MRSDHPIVYLSQRRREGVSRFLPVFWGLVALLAPLVVALALWFGAALLVRIEDAGLAGCTRAGIGSSPFVFGILAISLPIVAFALFTGGPAVLWCASLGLLQRGGCTAEFLATRTTPREWVDELLRRAIGEVWLILAASAVPLALATLASGDGLPEAATRYATLFPLAAGMAAIWLLAGFQQVRAGSGWLRRVLPALLAVPLVAGAVEGLSAPHPEYQLVANVLAGTGVVLLARHLAYRALERGGGEAGNARRRAANPWVRPWSDNPVVRRECARASRRVPFGLAGLVVLRYGPGLGLVALAWLLEDGCGNDLAWILAGLAALEAVVRSLVGAWRALDAITGERADGSLVLVAASPMDARQYAVGSVQAAAVPQILSALPLAAAAAVALAVAGHRAAAPLVLGVPLLAILTFTWVGFWAGVGSPSRRTALAYLVLIILGFSYGEMFVLVASMAAAATPGLDPAAVALTAVTFSLATVLAIARSQSLRLMGQEAPYLPGLTNP